MKKMMLVVLAMVMLSGCAAASKSWVREGTTPEQLTNHYQECVGPLYTNSGIAYYGNSTGQFQEDINFCVEAELHRKVKADQLSPIPFCYVIINKSAQGLAERCMSSKGYSKYPPRKKEDINKCMIEKGYEWK